MYPLLILYRLFSVTISSRKKVLISAGQSMKHSINDVFLLSSRKKVLISAGQYMKHSINDVFLLSSRKSNTIFPGRHQIKEWRFLEWRHQIKEWRFLEWRHQLKEWYRDFRWSHIQHLGEGAINEKHLSSELERWFLWSGGSRGSRTPDPLLVRQML